MERSAVYALTAPPKCQAGGGKLKFVARRDAKAASKRLAKVHKKRFRVYLCPSCNGWHLATRNKGEKS